ncbi:protein of unknown function DUF820 [Gloeothece citriformis PCC 7424]|uniref:Putative restriction endonuclease domain-containing protein n=1 Tax=Gloeothece citriformis (strain PCC 7424) TaxID=65393 RepID=B7KAK6_GLOC7|nr:Uma2 family endonuclease [Gloeothece citriformis]ACK68678.1 protein of unknown function DUF820 [Gloeothece citriformis PCC 7424]
MTSILIEDLTGELAIQAEDPEERFIIEAVSWEEYEKLLEKLGDSLRYRVTYLDGTLEIMSPSRRHEFDKKNISRLLEIYLEETRTPFWGLGSTTFRQEVKRGGLEPDECYCIGTEKEYPDLAIEVIASSGGINKLGVYQRLGVKEVWFWKSHDISVYCLRKDNYEQVTKSEILPELDLDLLIQYAIQPNPLEAVLGFRQAINS